MAQDAGTDAADLEISMTPMIDVVFQLLIFLMLANDMSRKEIEDLKLPPARHAVEDGADEADPRVIVNILEGGESGEPLLKVRGREWTLAEFKTRLLEQTARAGREADASAASKLSVLLRADARTRWRDVQFVMQACADPAIRVRRLQFATDEPTKAATAR